MTTAKAIGGKYLFFGGYEEAERVFFGAFPHWCDNFHSYFPIKALTFTFRQTDSLSHRDFLGTFMSLGITRESIGDILIEKGRAVAFVTEELADYIKTQVNKVGGVGVSVQDGFSYPLPGLSGFKEITETVSSARLDCIVASLIGCSRKSASEFIEDKRVSVNGMVCDKCVKTVKNGDKITLKGKGKFIIDSVDGRTKKDRLIIKAKKYI
jgi:RNA-binding protein YlmH